MSTIVISVRIDVRDLATLALFMESSGNRPSSKGNLCREMLELMSSHVKRVKADLNIESVSEALQILNSMGLGLSEGKRGRLSPSILEGVRLEDGFSLPQGKTSLITNKIIQDMAEEVSEDLTSEIPILRTSLGEIPSDIIDPSSQKLNEEEE